MARFPASLRTPALALALVGAAAGIATAVDLGGATIEILVELPTGDDDFTAPASEKDQLEFMNRASCLCPEVVFNVELTLGEAPPAIETAEVELWVGTGCNDPDTVIRDQKCSQVGSISDVEEIRNEVNRQISVRDLISTVGEECPEQRSSRAIYAMIDENDDGIDAEQGDHSFALQIDTDAEPPPLPENPAARGSERSISVSWDLPAARADDVEYFQVLCAPVGERELDPSVGGDEPRFLTSQMACDLDDGTRAEPAAGVVPRDDEVARLDPRFVCGETVGTGTSIRVDGLDNGVEYRIVLVSVDPSRNPSAIDLGVATPQPAQDFWEDYKANGGLAEGGCQAVGAGGGAGALAALGVLAAIGGVRRRRRAPAVGLAVGPAALLAALAASSGTAAAQPYLDDYAEPVSERFGPPPVAWNLDLKISPYLPGIDEQLDVPAGEEGPFAEMFGDAPFWLTSVTLDRFFLHPFGQLGVTGTIGYLSTSASAYVLDERGEVERTASGKPVRSDGDTTGFRLVPTSLGVVYRYTDLDDLVGVPLVPYGRLGLSYYLWWVTQPSGSVAEGPTADCPPEDVGESCDGDRALGGSLGWQGTVGLALRAERLDPGAETALRTELGIAHAGLFAELTYADVDGFGSERKLAVGDLHWSFGLNFEF